jgi:flagellin
MSRINTNVSSLIAQRVLRTNNDSLNTSLERLSTGLKINSGKDNPAGLIASENLRAEKAGITQAIDNAERANNIIGTAEGGLAEVSSLLTELQSLVGQAANTGGLSDEELAANQLQVDSILGTVNRIAGSTSFQGAKLLNGNYSYTTSGVATSAFTSLQVNAARLTDGTTKSIVVQVSNSATVGSLTFTGAAATIPGAAVTLEIAGNAGTEQLTFAGSSTNTSIVAAINSLTEATGVTATSGAGNTISFKSSNYGSDEFVSVRALSGTFAVTGGTSGKDFGSDAAVTVNGAAAEADGVNVSYRTNDLDIEFDLSTLSGAVQGLNNGKTKTIGITGGGATFALGSKVTTTDRASIGITSVSTGSLGDGTIGYLSALGSGGNNSLDSGNLVGAQKILDKAIKQVSQLRGRLGAFQKFTIGSTVNSLGVALENANAAESAIRDTDFAEETAKLTRSQILSQAATSVLAQANASPQRALSLLQ